MHTELFVRRSGENVIAIRTCANWFKRFKNGDFSNKELRTLCSCGRGQIAKRWEKILENDNINIWINLYYIDFFIVKKLQKIGKNF